MMDQNGRTESEKSEHEFPHAGGSQGNGHPIRSDPAEDKATFSSSGRTDQVREAAKLRDYPRPQALTDETEYVWDDDRPPVEHYAALGKRLAASGDLFRQPAYAAGLLLGVNQTNVEPCPVTTGKRLAPILTDRVRVRMVENGKTKRKAVSLAHLGVMICSEAFLQEFPPLDAVIKIAQYSPEFEMVRPGYNDGGPGHRLFYVGSEPQVSRSQETITKFLDVMAFATNADRTNAVAAALTVQLRNFWPGSKPAIIATATKSHAGKDTVIQFATGSTLSTPISYQTTDWALERCVVGALNHNPQTGVVIIDNARLSKGGKQIASGFLERILTDAQPLLFSTGTGRPVRRKNDLVLAISTNYGTISEDLMNRGLPIHLNPSGNVADRRSPIGNPKHEYLPANRDRIEAELRGMIEAWKEAGRPLDARVNHPFSDWARTIGGILQVNGFQDFLGNYSLRRTVDDPVRQSLGLLGAACPDKWLPATAWAQQAVARGVVRVLVNDADLGTDPGKARGMGVVLTAHRDETFTVETDDEKLTLKLERARLRFEGPEPSTRYRFVVQQHEAIPADQAPAQSDQ
jgi:hypothetical protein